ncbi:hypothetical protein CC2G_013777 [Coprinopsis cinerea AmutBmut pab1-1]|nr:hypothetical protein CC2G_013777 [Coprinopsis cinerea AmutBmut pab1-1]
MSKSVNKFVVVAQYGHPKLPGNKHWALILMDANDKMSPGVVYEVTGSTDSYTLKKPETVTPGKASSFMGMIAVGMVPVHQIDNIDNILRNTPVKTGDKTWHCQHWVMAALYNLRAAGFAVTPVDRDQLLAQFKAMETV